MRLAVVVLALAQVGCVRDSLVSCDDGRACPIGTICDVERATCIDPLGISVPEGVIDFAQLPCGGSQSVTVPLRNYGVSPIAFDATTTVSGVSVEPVTGTIEPGGDVTLTIVADSESQSIPGVPIEGSLILSTSYEIVTRPLRVTSIGALVTADATVDFGESAFPSQVTRPFTLRNTGNAPADVTITIPGTTFSRSLTGALRLDPALERSIDLRFNAPANGNFTADATLSFSGALCQPPPTTVALTGTSSADDVLVSQTVVDFGDSACDVAADVRTVTFTSTVIPQQMLALGISGSNIADYDAAATLMIPGNNGTASILISRKAIPSSTAVGTKSATLTGTASPSGETKVISLTHRVVAPVLTVSTSQIPFGMVQPEMTVSTNITVANGGNTPASVQVSSFKVEGTVIDASPSSFQIGPGASKQIAIVLRAGSKPVVITDGRLGFSAPGQCSAVPVIGVSAEIRP